MANSIDFSQIDIKDLIPHRGNMMLIDEVIEIKKEYAITAAIACETWPLLSTNGVNPLIMVEISAQSAGVCNGWDRICQKGINSDNMGWLVGVKRASFAVDTIPLYSKIITRSENTSKYDNLRITNSVLQINNNIIGEITLQLYQAPANDH